MHFKPIHPLSRPFSQLLTFFSTIFALIKPFCPVAKGLLFFCGDIEPPCCDPRLAPPADCLFNSPKWIRRAGSVTRLPGTWGPGGESERGLT